MRPRGQSKQAVPMPAHIDPRMLPKYCYWEGKGKTGHWYTKYKTNEGKYRRKRIAGPSARLSDLHRAMEEISGANLDDFDWLAQKYFAHYKFSELADQTKRGYQRCYDIVSSLPTKKNKPLGKIDLTLWKAPLVQKAVDKIAASNGPTSAVHCKQFISMLFNWGKPRGFTTDNPAQSIDLPKERKRNTMPERDTYKQVYSIAKERGYKKARTHGSSSWCIHAAIYISYRARCRGVEVFGLTDADIHEEGLFINRTKGSDSTVIAWDDELREIVSNAQKYRDDIWRKSRHPIPFKADKRPLIVGEAGKAITQSGWQSIWRSFMTTLIDEGLIQPGQRFTLHGMKHRGITDTPGSKADKMELAGLSSIQMVKVYDHSVPIVPPAPF